MKAAEDQHSGKCQQQVRIIKTAAIAVVFDPVQQNTHREMSGFQRCGYSFEMTHVIIKIVSVDIGVGAVKRCSCQQRQENDHQHHPLIFRFGKVQKEFAVFFRRDETQQYNHANNQNEGGNYSMFQQGRFIKYVIRADNKAVNVQFLCGRIP